MTLLNEPQQIVLYREAPLLEAQPQQHRNRSNHDQLATPLHPQLHIEQPVALIEALDAYYLIMYLLGKAER